MTVDNQTKQAADILKRLMVCTAKHQGNPQEWVDGRCITPSQAKKAIDQLLAQAEARGRNEVFQAIQDGTLIMRRFMTKEQVKAEYEASLKEMEN